MATQNNAPLESVLESIEAKLETLEANREEIHNQLELKRAQIRNMTRAIELLYEIDAGPQGE